MTVAVERVVRFFSESAKPVIFTGAGVSAATGVPILGALLKNMAEWLRSRDPLTANKVIELVAKYDYLRAAGMFFMSDGATEKEKFTLLVNELLPTRPEAIDDLCSLPFTAAVTTNFDRTLFDGIAAARRISAKDYRRGDSSFKNALFAEDLYVARIHGFVEDPQSIVLTQQHFNDLEKDTFYKDFVVNIFTKKNLLLLGFSFSDPAILSILQSVNKEYGPLAIGNHLALVPSDVSSDIERLLHRLNIEAVKYDRNPDDINHSNLWKTISDASNQIRKTAAPIVALAQKVQNSPFDTAKQYLASCYARANLGSQIGPLREAIVEGMVSAIIQASAPKAVPMNVLIEKIHIDTNINLRDAEELVTKSLAVLSDEKLCAWHKRSGEKKVSWIGIAKDESHLEKAISKLVDSTVDRALVEEGFRATSDIKRSLNNFYTQLVLQRGWDLGASFAGGRIPNGYDIKTLMYQCARTVSTIDIELLVRVCERMIQNPTSEEAEILAALGRASFGLELAMQAPRTQLLHAVTLPSRIYLDANVVMPAFTFGHTYHGVYSDTIESLHRASAANGGVQICTTFGYLNEIVSHRRLAVEQFEENSEFFRDDAIKEAIFSGATNMNVFVGAYANLASADKDLDFPDFLRKYAPFTTEIELSNWLGKRGVHLVKKQQITGTLSQSDISLELQKGYASSLKSNKDVRLLDHDSVLLSSLSRDIENGIRAIVVTADKRLRDVVGSSKLKSLATHMVSHVGLAQLVDLLVGNISENRSLAHLLWDATISERSSELRRYFIGLALQHYDDAMAMELPGLVDRFTDEVINEAKRKGLNSINRISGEQRGWFQIAGSFEDKFFNAMSEKIETRSRKNSDIK